MIQKHKKLEKKLIFAGGVWVWDGFLPNNAYTIQTMIPTMKACIDEGIETVVLTAWEDDGWETNHFMSLPGLAIVSEYCFGGKETSVEQIREMSSFITGMDYDAIDTMSVFHNGEIGDVKAGKRYIWSDFLYNLTDYRTDFEAMETRFLQASDCLNDKKGKYEELYEYVALLFEIARNKCVFPRKLREAYVNNDREYLQNACDEILPKFKRDYSRLHKIHKKQWLDTYKPFGGETLDGRYAMLEARAEYAAERIADYLSGEINVIDELEEKTLFGITPRGGWFANMAYTSVIR